MSDYKRWISYIYYYEKNVKKNNIGYVRVETRGEMTKLTLHINVLSVVEPMNVYMLYKNHENNMDEGIKIGTILMDKGVGHGVYSTRTFNIMETGLAVNNIRGIMVFHNKDRFYASAWDDNEIDIEKFMVYSEPEIIPEKEIYGDKIYENEAAENEVISEKLQEISEMYEIPEISKIMKTPETTEEPEMPKMLETPEELRMPEMPETAEELRMSEMPIYPELTETGDKNVEIIPELAAAHDRTESQLVIAAENVLKIYPYMYPFEDDDIEACVRIEPKDIENLPINTWIIANNSFLLKGYYGYRHLIFFKIGKENPRYMIGVPGINHNRDNFLANMFGFRLFRPIKKTKDVRGEYGYWCIAVDNN